MPSNLNIEILPNELTQIVEGVYVTMMGLDPAKGMVPWFPSTDRLTSAVHLGGDWNGVLLVECDKEQACRYAGRFLSMDPPGTVDDVVRDVLGELANMIGGNLKCVLSRGIRLSMPTVVDGSDYGLRVCRSEVRERLAFQCAEGPFWVTVLANECSLTL